MKVFLLFLLVSFFIGANQQAAAPQRRHWLMGAFVIIMGVSYFFFDQLI
jgi:hypothetical protein